MPDKGRRCIFAATCGSLGYPGCTLGKTSAPGGQCDTGTTQLREVMKPLPLQFSGFSQTKPCLTLYKAGDSPASGRRLNQTTLGDSFQPTFLRLDENYRHRQAKQDALNQEMEQYLQNWKSDGLEAFESPSLWDHVLISNQVLQVCHVHQSIIVKLQP